MFLEISQNSQKNTCARDSFFPATLLKKSLWYRCFPVNFAKFLRTPFLQNISGRLLLLFPRKTAYSSNNSHNAYKNAPNKHSSWWRPTEDVLKTSWRHNYKTSCKHILKTSWRHIGRRLEDVLKMSWRCLEDVLGRLFKTSWKTKSVMLKMSLRNVCWADGNSKFI